MDRQTMLAAYRTRLAEKRTAISQLQLGFVLVTVPITVHAAFMMIADRHGAPRPALVSGIGVVVALLVVLAGVSLAAAAVRDLWRCGAAVRSLRREIEAPLDYTSDRETASIALSPSPKRAIDVRCRSSSP